MITIDRVGRAVRENPAGLLLLGAGIALILRQTAGVDTRSSNNRSASGRNYNSSSNNSAEKDIGDTGLREKVSAATEDARDYVADTASALAEKASQYTQAASRGTRDAAESAYDSVEGVINAHPLTIAVAGAAAGCLVAAAFPSTRFERDTLGPVGRRAAEAAWEAGARVKSMAAEAGEAMKDDAPDRKLNKTDNGSAGTQTGATNPPSKVVDTGEVKAKPSQGQPATKNQRF